MCVLQEKSKAREAVVESGVTGAHVWGITAEEGGREGPRRSKSHLWRSEGGFQSIYCIVRYIGWERGNLGGWSDGRVRVCLFFPSHTDILKITLAALFLNSSSSL